MNISVCIPSYKRPKVKTLDYIPYAKVFVDYKEYNEYLEENKEGSCIVACPEGIQGNVARVRNYILDTEFDGGGADVVVMLDDDMKGMYYWQNNEECELKTEDFLDFIEKYSNLAIEWGAYFWGVNLNPDRQCYKEFRPFNTLNFIGGPFQCFIKGGGCRYDERLPLKEDYDMTLQHLNKHRKTLRVNKYFYKVKQSEQAGGCAMMRNFKKEKEQLELLQKKWGNNIVKQDKSNSANLKKKKTNIDYNPIIKVPIKGV